MIKTNFCVNLIEKIILNIYDHLIFRSCSLLLFDILINCICYSNNLALTIVVFVIMIIFVFIYFFNYKTFRLCQKFNKNCKYIYDAEFMQFYDFAILIIKIFISFDENITNDVLTFFFNMIEVALVIYMNYYYVKNISVNCISCFKGSSIISYFLIIVFYLIFDNLLQENSIFYLYLVFCLIGASCFTYLLKCLKIALVMNHSLNGDEKDIKKALIC